MKKGRVIRQIAVLPVRRTHSRLEILLMTSRGTKRFVVPKGWPMKGWTDGEAAAIEAKQEAGLVGTVSPEPLGTYNYWKRMKSIFVPISVSVYRMDVERELDQYREAGQREKAWLSLDQAIRLLDEPDLGSLIAEIS